MKRILIILVLPLSLFLSREAFPQTLPESVGSWFGALSGGGSLTGSSANTLGGLGHFSVCLSAGLVRPSLIGADYTAGAVSGILSLGILEGTDFGPAVHGVGSLDVYVRAGSMYLNAVHSTNADLIGAGVRLGILRNSILAPAVSVSLGYQKTGDLTMRLGPASQALLNPEAEISTTAFRIEASKNLFVITPYAGVGVNRNKAKISVAGVKIEGSENDAVYYGGVEWNILLLRLGLEVGHTGEDTFATLGARITL